MSPGVLVGVAPNSFASMSLTALRMMDMGGAEGTVVGLVVTTGVTGTGVDEVFVLISSRIVTGTKVEGVFWLISSRIVTGAIVADLSHGKGVLHQVSVTSRHFSGSIGILDEVARLQTGHTHGGRHTC